MWIKFRKKPVVIEAILWDGKKETADAIGKASAERYVLYDHDIVYDVLYIRTLEGTMQARIGDWIIKGVKGEIYPCKPDIFRATYEMVGE